MVDKEELNQSDYLAGSLIRQMLENIRKEGKKVVDANKYALEYCDYALVIMPCDNGRGGTWVYYGKEYLVDDMPGIRQEQNGFDYDFYCIKTYINNLKNTYNYNENSFLIKLLKDIEAGKRNYDFVVNSKSYTCTAEEHDKNTEEIFNYVSFVYPQSKEVR